MSSKLLKICSMFVLTLGMESVESLEQGENGGSSILIKANSADVSISGEVKDIISVEFDEGKKELRLFEDNGEETSSDYRTFSFEIKTMTSTGAKLKLEGKDGLSFDGSNRCWTLSKADGDTENDNIKIWFQLMGRSRGTEDGEGVLEQRGWDEDGCCYTFKQYDGVGEWRIIAHSVKKITEEGSGVYKGSLKVSIVAA